MKKGFIHHNGIVQVHKEDEGLVEGKVRPKIYALKQNPMSGEYFLEEEKEAYNVGKIYGTIQTQRADRIVKAYLESEKNLGVLLSGTKGTGKTVLIKLIANIAVKDLQVPVITINQRFAGDAFNAFIEDIGECVVLFDEFTKVYRHKEEQEALLTLFDGLNSTKRLSILTSNEPNQVSEFFIDRPGRILYHFEYTNLDRETFEGYLEDCLKVEHFRKNIIRSYENATMFSFDMLQTLVKECNAYPDLQYRDITIPLNITELRSKRYLKFISIEQPENKEKEQKAVKLTVKDFEYYYDAEEVDHPEEILLPTFGGSFTPTDYMDFDRSLGLNFEDVEKEDSESRNKRFKEYRTIRNKRITDLRNQPACNNIRLTYENYVGDENGTCIYLDKSTGVKLIVEEVWR